MKDSACRRGYVRTAELTGVDLATSDAVVSGNLLAFLAINTLWKAGFFKELKTSIFIGKLLLKIFDSVSFHCHSPNLALYLHYSTKTP